MSLVLGVKNTPKEGLFSNQNKGHLGPSVQGAGQIMEVMTHDPHGEDGRYGRYIFYLPLKLLSIILSL